VTRADQQALVYSALTSGIIGDSKRARILLKSPGPDAFSDPFLREVWSAMQALASSRYKITLPSVARMMRQLRGSPERKLGGKDVAALVKLVEDYAAQLERRQLVYRKAILMVSIAELLLEDATDELAALVAESEPEPRSERCVA
jgi:hypothetical protein